METLLFTGLSNALVAAVLALVAFAASRLTRSAPLAHFLWTLVLLKLVSPPLLEVDLRPAARLFEVRPSQDPPPPAVVDAAAAPRTPAATLGQIGSDWPFESSTVDLEVEAPADAVLPASTPLHRLPPIEESPAPDPLPVATALPAHGRWSPDPALLAGVAWLSGSLLWSALAASRILRFRRLLRNARPAPAEIVEEVRCVAKRMELKRAPAVVVVAATISPLVWTLGARATLVLPGELLSSLGAKERRTLLAHELAHLRRRDHWWRLLELLLLALYWWLPVAWWARGQLRKVEEECCDGWVDWAFPEHRREYAGTLLRTVDFLSRSPAALPEGVSGMGQVSLLRRRLTMILQGRLTRRLPAAGQVLLVSLAALVLPWAAGLSSQDEPGVGQATPPAERAAPPAEAGGKSLPPSPVHEPEAGDDDAWPATEPSRRPDDQREQLNLLLLQLRRIMEEINSPDRINVPAGLGAPGANRPGQRRVAGPRAFRFEGEVVSVLDPRSGKTLWMSLMGEDVVNAERAQDGKTLRVRTRGKTVVLDVATGKILQEDKFAVDPAEPGNARGAARTQSLSMRLDPYGPRSLYGTMAAETGGALAGPRVDLVGLADALIEAEGAARSAQSRLESPVDSPTEAKSARIQADTAARKADLLRRMARSALKRTSDEVKRLEELEVTAKVRFNAQQVPVESLAAISGRLGQARLAVDLLEEILAEPRQ